MLEAFQYPHPRALWHPRLEITGETAHGLLREITAVWKLIPLVLPQNPVRTATGIQAG